MEACFSGPSIAVLGILATAIQAAIVTVFWLYVRSQTRQIVTAEAREAEWKRLAIRGADEIIPSLAMEVRGRLREVRELREPLEP